MELVEYKNLLLKEMTLENQINRIGCNIPKEKEEKLKELEIVKNKLQSVTEEELKKLEQKEAEENLIHTYYNLGIAYKEFLNTQEEILNKNPNLKEILNQTKIILFVQKEQNETQNSFQKELELAYKLGTKELINEKSYTEEEIQTCEQTLGLKISKQNNG